MAMACLFPMMSRLYTLEFLWLGRGRGQGQGEVRARVKVRVRINALLIFRPLIAASGHNDRHQNTRSGSRGVRDNGATAKRTAGDDKRGRGKSSRRAGSRRLRSDRREPTNKVHALRLILIY